MSEGFAVRRNGHYWCLRESSPAESKRLNRIPGISNRSSKNRKENGNGKRKASQVGRSGDKEAACP